MPARKTVSLNGTWDLVFDPKNQGKKKRWCNRLPKSAPMSVPGVWEQIKPNYDGVAWYERTFKAPRAWQDRAVRLRFGAVFYYCEVWLNGRALGAHEGGFAPFEFDITKHLQAGANKVTVRVIGPPMNHEIEGLRAGAPLNQGNLPVGKAGWYFNFGGIWQDVSLVVTDQVYVDDIYVQPYPRQKKAVVNVTVRNTERRTRAKLVCEIRPAKGEGRPAVRLEKTVTLKKGATEVILNARFRSVHLWSTDDPFLYVAEVTVQKGDACCDTLGVRFGMREFNIKNGQFELNGKVIKLKGFLQQGMYARTLIFPDTKAMARKELKLIKDNGFNFIRAHLKPADPHWLDLCDEMGILVEGEPALGWISNSPETEKRCANEIRGLLKRDRNRASVIFWCLMNEAYHFRSFTMPEIKRLTKRLASMARRLDSTRLLMDTSGGAGGTEQDGTSVMLPNTTRMADMVDAHAYCPLPPRDEDIVRYRTMGRRGLPLFVSEYGAPDTPPDYAKVMQSYTAAERRLGLEDYVLHKDFFDSLKANFRQARLKKLFGSVEGYMREINRVRADEVRLVTEAMRANPNLAGLTFCQLADASGELFGALDVWRRPKAAFKTLCDAVRTPLLVPEITPRVVAAGEAQSVRATLVNEDQLGMRYDYRVEVVDGRGRARRVSAGKIKAKADVQTVLAKTLSLDLKPGAYTLRTTLKLGRKTVAASTMDFTVLAAPQIQAEAVGLHDPRGVLTPVLQKLGVACPAFTNNFREKEYPVLMDLRQGIQNPVLVFEIFGQLKKIVQTGGCALLLEPETSVLYEVLFPKLLRLARVSRSATYVVPHPVFEGLPSKCVAGYEYAYVSPTRWTRPDDILSSGGTVLMGGLSSHMWTRPADYCWGAAVYTIPIGRGQVIVSQLGIGDALKTNATARSLLANLVNYAASQIRPGHEDLLLSRCIDPINPRLLGR